MARKPLKFSEEIRFFAVFKLFGLAPCSKKWKMLLVLYSLLLMGITIFLLYSAFFIISIFGFSSGSSLASLIGQLMFCGLITTSVIILLQSLFCISESEQILEKFDTIYSILTEKLFVERRASKMKRKLLWKIFSIIVFLLIVVIYNFALLIYWNQDINYTLFCLWPIIIIRARCIQNIFLIDVLTEFLKMLNEKIEEIIGKTQKVAPNDEVFILRYDKREYGEVVFSDYSEILLLKDVYGYIWDLTNLYNDGFGWSLLALATQNFLEFTCNGYWLFLAFLDGEISRLNSINALCTIIPVVFVLTNIAYSCYCAFESGTQTGSLIYKLEKDNASKNPEHNSIIREFSLQVAHEQIVISANGFFNIDFSLLGSMAAATVTYLVILIQFQQSEKRQV